MPSATARRSGTAQLVYQQLSEDFPRSACSWALDKRVRWLPLHRVPVRMIDYGNAKNWNAAKHPKKIAHFQEKLVRGDDKPIVLVVRPGKDKAMVADGHHRALAALEEGKAPLAYVCRVWTARGPWDEMHAEQKNSSGGVKLANPAPPADPAGTTQPAGTAPPPAADDSLALIAATTLAAMAIPPGLTAASIGLMLARQSAGQRLVQRFSQAGVPPQALYAAIEVTISLQGDLHGMSGPATRNMIVLNQARRGQYLVMAARRITAAIRRAHSRDESVLEAIRDAMEAERRFYGQHLQAGWNRMNAAARVDDAWRSLGTLLGWNAVHDSKTSAECRAADGKNFRADIMPSIGYPGMVHPHCRCYPGPPHPRARLLS